MSLDRTSLALCVDVLGPLVLRVAGRGGRRPRRTPARRCSPLLALEAGRGVSADRLVDALWPDDPPANAVQALYNHVSRLRGHLGAARGPPGAARRRLPPAPRARRAGRRRGSSARARGRPDRARTLPSPRSWPASALALWRGPALERVPRRCPRWRSSRWRSTSCGSSSSTTWSRPGWRSGDRTVVVDASAAAAASPLRERTALLHVRALADRRPDRGGDGRRAGATGGGSPTRPASTRGPPWPSSSSASPPARSRQPTPGRRIGSAPGRPPRQPDGRPRARP